MAIEVDTRRTKRLIHINGEQYKQNTLTKGAGSGHVTLDIVNMGLTFLLLDAP